MAKLPTFTDDSPVIGNLPVDTSGEAHVKIADMIGSVSKQIIGNVLTAKKATSNAALFSQNAALTNAKTDAITQMKLNPGNAPQIANNFNKHVDLINKNISLIPSDQQKLSVLSANAVNGVKNSALLTSGKQIRLTESMNFQTEFPEQLKEIARHLHNAPAVAAMQIETSSKMISDGLVHGFITPTQAKNYQSLIDSAINRHQQLATFVRGGGKPIDGLHALTNVPGEANENLPTQSGTFFHYTTLKQNVSFGDAVSDLHRGQIDGAVASDLSKDNFQKYLLSAQGIDNAQATINSGNHFSFIQKRFDVLNSKPASTLSTGEKA